MRRKIIIMAVSLLLVTALQCYASLYTRSVADDAIASIDRLSGAVNSNDWPLARSLMEPLDRAWHEACAPMDWWISRIMMDEIHVTMRELAISLEAEDYFETRRLLEELRDSIVEITHWDDLTLSNVV